MFNLKVQIARLHRIGDHLSPARIVGFMAVTVLAMICLLAVSLYNSYQDTRRNAEQHADNVVNALTQDIERVISSLNLSLEGAAEAWRRPELQSLNPVMRNLALFDRSATGGDKGNVIIIDARGDVIIHSRDPRPSTINLADRDFFLAHKQNLDVGLHVSEPIRTRTGGDWALILSRRLDNPDGSFGGVASASIKLDYLRTLFERVSLGPSSAITLISASGRIVLRSPFEERAIGRLIGGLNDVPSADLARYASFRRTSSIDGIDRLVTYRRIGELPLYQVVGLSWNAIFADWWARTAVLGIAFGLLVVGIALLTAVVASELARRIQAEKELAELARTDALTGLGNRRAFDEAFSQEWRRALAPRHHTALLMVDVDHFKRFNDNYGHQSGDFALEAVAACIKRALTWPADMAARYGGEEFAVLLPNTSPQRAVAVARRIQAALAAAEIPHRGSPVGSLTTSIGIAVGSARDFAEEAELLAAADAALYRAKNGGRNRIELPMLPAGESETPQTHAA